MSQTYYEQHISIPTNSINLQGNILTNNCVVKNNDNIDNIFNDWDLVDYNYYDVAIDIVCPINTFKVVFLYIIDYFIEFEIDTINKYENLNDKTKQKIENFLTYSKNENK